MISDINPLYYYLHCNNTFEINNHKIGSDYRKDLPKIFVLQCAKID